VTIYFTKVWGFGEPVGPLQFSSSGWRQNAREVLKEGDLVVLVGTQSSPTLPDEQGHLLGIVEPSTLPVMSLDFEMATRPEDFGPTGEYKWPYGLLNKRAWRLVDRPRLKEISERDFAMNSALGIVAFTEEEAGKIRALRRSEMRIIEPILSARRRIERVTTGRTSMNAPVPTTTRRGVMHMRRAEAYTYAMEISGAVKPSFKVGWAFDYADRQRTFNKASLPELGGVRYVSRLFKEWETAKDAYLMERRLLDVFKEKRALSNSEVLQGLSFGDLFAGWQKCLMP